MSKVLSFTFSTTPDSKPVAFLNNMPSSGAELSPADLRSIAQVLMMAADECDSINTESSVSIPQQRTYALNTAQPALPNADMSFSLAMGDAMSLIHQDSAAA